MGMGKRVTEGGAAMAEGVPEDLARADGLWTALALFITVLFFLGLAAYLYWAGTGRLPWD
jgi:hypothetical protein